MAIKYNDLYMDLRRRLREAGAEDATQAARELVCTASGKTKNELLRDGLLYASPEVERAAYSLCARHLAGEPVAQVLSLLRQGQVSWDPGYDGVYGTLRLPGTKRKGPPLPMAPSRKEEE